MDSRVEERVRSKATESLGASDEIRALAEALADPSTDVASLTLGIMAGRLYNSFHYQSRRILKRDPSPEEFAEFLDIISANRGRFLKELGL